MEEIYKSNVWTIYWHEAPKCLHFVFQEYTKDMEEEEYRKELKNFIEIVKERQPKTIYADTRGFYFVIAPEVQEFINENILTLYNQIKVEKHAILVSQDIFTSVSVEQTMEENEEEGFVNKYFEDEEKVKAWLNL